MEPKTFPYNYKRLVVTFLNMVFRNSLPHKNAKECDLLEDAEKLVA